MTRRNALPDPATVQAAIAHLDALHGRAPSVLALARHLGLANTTFRRHYPDITTTLTRSTPNTPQPGTGTDNRVARLHRDNVRLRRDNQSLTEHLELALANIQRLTLDNNHLVQRLHDATGVRPLTPRRST
ncbi:hypothetical protein [Lentzea sp. E54]|uniref:hypothetical protein n=1 Tax=Lentzea xerophila TaxID=3435883 RepID=UPI003DA65291